MDDPGRTRRWSRRQAIRAAAAAAAATGPFASRWAAAAGPPGRTLLILGGTGFIGPHLTERALSQGWRVTHFNRGRRSDSALPGVETLLGDRNGQLEALRGRRWDVVIDNTGFVPKYVRQSAELLAPQVGFCLFVSSIAVYASFATANDEQSPTGVLADPEVEKVLQDDTYGPMKSLCERYSREAFEDRLCVVRPGYIVGPGDRSDLLTYWPVRAARGGEMLAPGTPNDPIQIIDVRDLAAWMLQLCERRTTGVFNAISAPRAFTIGALLRASVAASPRAGTRVTWVSEDLLPTRWKHERSYLLPWRPRQGDSAAEPLTATDRAVRAGLKIRPLEQTVRDTLSWYQSLPPGSHPLHMGIDPTEEAQLLRSLNSAAPQARPVQPR